MGQTQVFRTLRGEIDPGEPENAIDTFFLYFHSKKWHCSKTPGLWGAQKKRPPFFSDVRPPLFAAVNQGGSVPFDGLVATVQK